MMTAVLFIMEDCVEIRITEPIRFTFHVLVEKKSERLYVAKCLDLCLTVAAEDRDGAIERIIKLMRSQCATGIRLSQIGCTNLLVPMKRDDFEEFWNLLRTGSCVLVENGRMELTDMDITNVVLPPEPAFQGSDPKVSPNFWKGMVFEYQIFVKSEHIQ